MASSCAILDVNQLSDDDIATTNDAAASGLALKSGGAPPHAKRMPARKQGPKVKLAGHNPRDLRLVRNKVNGHCGCLCQCFNPFRDSAVFANLAKVLQTLNSMDKLTQDDYA